MEKEVTDDERENSALQDSDQLADDHSSEENNNQMLTYSDSVHLAVCPKGDEVQAQSCSEAAIANIEEIEENGGKLIEPKSDRHENLQEKIQHAVPDKMVEQGETALITYREKAPEQPDENTSMAREKIANMKASFKSAEKSEEDEGSSENEVNASVGGLGKDDEQQRQEVMEELEKENDENLREEIIKNNSKRLETENAGIQESSKKSPGQRELETKASEHVGELRSKDNEEGRVEGRIIENSIDNIEDSKSPSKVLPKKERKEKIRNVIPQLRVRANIKFAEIKGKGIKLQQPVVTDPPNDEKPPTERELEGGGGDSL